MVLWLLYLYFILYILYSYREFLVIMCLVEVYLMVDYRVFVDSQLCKGCGICVEVCPRGVLELSGLSPETGYMNPELVGKCIGCRLCMWFCPDFAIVVEGV